MLDLLLGLAALDDSIDRNKGMSRRALVVTEGLRVIIGLRCQGAAPWWVTVSQPTCGTLVNTRGKVIHAVLSRQ
jgi:hypothetical protein